MTRAVLLLAVAAVLAGCGDGDAAAPTDTLAPEPEADVPSDQPPALVVRDFVDAAADGRAEALFDLLTEASRERLGPTLEEFAAGPARELEEGVGSFGRDGDFEVVLSEPISDDLAVTTILGRRTAEGMRELGAYAAILRREGGAWRISIGAGPEIEPLAPPPGARVAPETSPTARVAAEADDAFFWIDDRAARPEESPDAPPRDPDEGIVGVDVVPPLAPGAHAVTVVALADGEARALAWAFTVV